MTAASDAAIRALVESNPGQATFEEYRLVHDSVVSRSPCNMLVFGVGRDSSLWLTANREGTTVFLESDPAWATTVRAQDPDIVIHAVRYRGRRILWPWARAFPAALSMTALPESVEDHRWHVILVDAPRGTRWHSRGRLGSIRTAARLGLASGADLFVHDCHRKLERECSDYFLGPDLLRAQAGSMRHYRCG